MVRSSGWETGSSGSPLRPRELLTCLLGACCSLRRPRWELRRSRGVWGRGKQLTGFLDWGREAREREDQVERRMRDHNGAGRTGTGGGEKGSELPRGRRCWQRGSLGAQQRVAHRTPIFGVGRRGVSAHLGGVGALVGFIREPFALLPGGDAPVGPPPSQRAAPGGRPLSNLRGLHAGAPQRLRRVARLHLLVRDGAQHVGRLEGRNHTRQPPGCRGRGKRGGCVPPPPPSALTRLSRG